MKKNFSLPVSLLAIGMVLAQCIAPMSTSAGPPTEPASPSNTPAPLAKLSDQTTIHAARHGNPFDLAEAGAGLQYYSLPAPVRLLETRSGQTGCFNPGEPLAGGATRTQQARGSCAGASIPTTAQAIVGNATAINASGFGFVTLWPSGQPQPNASNLSFTANQTVPNFFTVGLGNDGAFNIFASATTDFTVDISGYYAPPGIGGLFFYPLPAPVRLLNTQPGQSACDNPGAPLAGDVTRTQNVRGTCTIPASAQAVVGNATVVNLISSGGRITLWPAGPPPNASNLNFTASQTVPNAFIVGLSSNGTFNIRSSATTHFIVDVAGYFSPEPGDVNGSGLVLNPLSAPVRLLDTQPGQTACFNPGAPLPGGATRTQQARGSCGIPATAQAVVGNATAINASALGSIALWPSGQPQPNASNLNFTANQTVPNFFTVGLGSDGAFKIFASATTHFIVDLTGYFAPGSNLPLRVTNANDTGAGSLRQTIIDANNMPGPDISVFNIGGGGVQTIRLGSALPEITDPLTIDAL